MQVPLPLAPVIDQTREIPSDVALQISAVYACVELLANTIGTLPLFVYADEGGGRVPARSSRLWMLLHERPNAWMTPSEFYSAMTVNRLLRGNAYARIERDSSGEPIALIPVSPDQMEVSVVGEVRSTPTIRTARFRSGRLKTSFIGRVLATGSWGSRSSSSCELR